MKVLLHLEKTPMFSVISFHIWEEVTVPSCTRNASHGVLRHNRPPALIPPIANLSRPALPGPSLGHPGTEPSEREGTNPPPTTTTSPHLHGKTEGQGWGPRSVCIPRECFLLRIEKLKRLRVAPFPGQGRSYSPNSSVTVT